MILRYCSVILALFAFPAANAFTSSLSSRRKNVPSRVILGISSDEILANARKKAGIPKEQTFEIFGADIVRDMTSALRTLERRIKEGSGALSSYEVEELDGELKRIIAEMKLNPHKTVQSAVIEDKAVAAPQAPPPKKVTSKVTDTSLDEGPKFDGGGMGQPKGTINTYVIEGMDEMSPEEYQKALQDSVIERQKQRRASITTGNKASWDYLNHLTGEKGILNEDE